MILAAGARRRSRCLGGAGIDHSEVTGGRISTCDGDRSSRTRSCASAHGSVVVLALALLLALALTLGYGGFESGLRSSRQRSG